MCRLRFGAVELLTIMRTTNPILFHAEKVDRRNRAECTVHNASASVKLSDFSTANGLARSVVARLADIKPCIQYIVRLGLYVPVVP